MRARGSAVFWAITAPIRTTTSRTRSSAARRRRVEFTSCYCDERIKPHSRARVVVSAVDGAKS